MKKEEITALFGKFESISCEVEGIECWSARELQPLLGSADAALAVHRELHRQANL